jgi:hypothetical protein
MNNTTLRPGVAVALIMGAWCLAACQPGKVEIAAPVTESTDAVLPAAGELTGWDLASEPESYGPDNLWDYINGQAEFYLSYGFVRVDTAEYRAQGGSPSVLVEVYQMASPEEAFGIFAAERSTEDRSIEIGSGGYLGSNILNFWQGKNYIKLISFESEASTEDALMALARQISTRNPAGSGLPETFAYFPDEERIESSERYFPRDFLGQEYLDRAYRIDYSSSDGGAHQLFLIRLDSPDEARSALTLYADFQRSLGRDVELIEGESATMVAESGTATVVFVRSEFIGGVLDAATLELGSQVAKEFAERLTSVRKSTK